MGMRNKTTQRKAKDKNVEFTAEAQKEMHEVANYIGQEFNPTAELVLDRMDKSSKEVSALCKQHGYMAVAKACAKIIGGPVS